MCCDLLSFLSDMMVCSAVSRCLQLDLQPHLTEGSAVPGQAECGTKRITILSGCRVPCNTQPLLQLFTSFTAGHGAATSRSLLGRWPAPSAAGRGHTAGIPPTSRASSGFRSHGKTRWALKKGIGHFCVIVTWQCQCPEQGGTAGRQPRQMAESTSARTAGCWCSFGCSCGCDMALG
jgi:hypothetical protein